MIRNGKVQLPKPEKAWRIVGNTVEELPTMDTELNMREVNESLPPLLVSFEAAVIDDQLAWAVRVSGDTYPHKDWLKGLGLRWDPYHKAWEGKATQAILDTLAQSGLCIVIIREGDIARLQMEQEAAGELPPWKGEIWLLGASYRDPRWWVG